MQVDSARSAAQGTPLLQGRRQLLAMRAHACGLLPAMQRIRGLFRRDLRVLAYHRVRALDPGFAFDPELVSATPEDFREQVGYLRDRLHPVSCREVVAALDGGPTLPRDAVMITFDDGYDDNHAIAFPILRDLGVPATFFVATGHIDSGLPYAYDWMVHLVLGTDSDRLRLPGLRLDLPLPADRGERIAICGSLLDRLKYLDDDGQQAVIGELERELRYPRTLGHDDCRPMTWDQLREMRDGGMEIGAHGTHHRMLAKLPDDALRAEISECQARLTAELGAPAIAVSYPVGGPDAFDGRTIAAVREHGFRIGFSYVSGTNSLPASDRYQLRRTPIERCIDDAWFRAILAVPELFAYRSTLRVYPS